MESSVITNNKTGFHTLSLGIVCPMANERNTAEQFVHDVLQICRQFTFKSISFYVIFDNACTDGTMKLLQNMKDYPPELKIIFSPENTCVVDAYMRGYMEALEDKHDWILEIDAGYSHQPEDIPRLLNTMSTGFDCVFGSRFIQGSKTKFNNSYRYLISRGGTFLVNCFIGTHLKDMTSGFEIFTHQALSAILDEKILSKGPFFQTEIKTHAHNFNITEVPIHYKDASHNVNSTSLKDAFYCLWQLYRKKSAKKKIL